MPVSGNNDKLPGRNGRRAANTIAQASTAARGTYAPSDTVSYIYWIRDDDDVAAPFSRGVGI